MHNIYVKHKLTVPVLVLALLLALPAGPAFAVSLWSDSPQANLFSDHKAHAVGDILTIIVDETSSASRVGAANNSKATDVKMNAGTGIFHGIASATAGNSDSFKAAGSITNSNNVSAKITVQVTDIKPNGNLLISGTQSIKQNGEEQKIVVSGEVRPDDVAADNTVLSYYVANAQIRIDGKGPLANKQRQGLITQIFNFLF
jgi:flagellar L-ring protein precursor FlgH